MNTKTNFRQFNEDDFIEVDNQMRELTVTITLCEFRNLITELARSEQKMLQLFDENEKLKNQNKYLLQAVLKSNPELLNNISNSLDSIIDMFVSNEESEGVENGD